MAAELDGPRLAPRSGRARQLVVFLHGYGADGNDLIEIGRAWQPLLPEAAFVSPHAPEPCGQGAVKTGPLYPPPPPATDAPADAPTGGGRASAGIKGFQTTLGAMPHSVFLGCHCLGIGLQDAAAAQETDGHRG